MIEHIGDNGYDQNFERHPIVIEDTEGLHIALNAIMEMQRKTLHLLQEMREAGEVAIIFPEEA